MFIANEFLKVIYYILSLEVCIIFCLVYVVPKLQENPKYSKSHLKCVFATRGTNMKKLKMRKSSISAKESLKLIFFESDGGGGGEGVRED